VSALQVIGGIVSALLLVYLCAALLVPEKLQ
jgi:K+-transporting ATPase KdpF subunit